MTTATDQYSDSDRVSVELDQQSGIAVMTMNKAPANTFSLDYLTELNTILDRLHADENCGALVITSGLRGLFSAGLELTELYKPEPEPLRQLFGTLQEVMMKIYTSRLATAAAINGHSPAGGCLAAMCCDYRVMASGKYAIGLNETQLGMSPPPWFGRLMLSLVGRRQTDRALQLGTLFPVDTALKIGLIDEVCEENKVVDRAKEELQQWLKIPAPARAMSKLLVRQSLVDMVVSRREEEFQMTLSSLKRPDTERKLGRYLASMAKTKTK